MKVEKFWLFFHSICTLLKQLCELSLIADSFVGIPECMYKKWKALSKIRKATVCKNINAPLQ